MGERVLARDGISVLVTVCKSAQAPADPAPAAVHPRSEAGPVSGALKGKLMHSSAPLFALLFMQG